MKSLLLSILFIISSSIIAIAQQDTTCNFLKDVKFHNGTATIIVEGYYHDYHRSGDEPLLMYLSKQKKLNYYDYGSNDAGCSGISFVPVGCTRRADGPIKHKAKFDPAKVKDGDKLRITCLVSEDEKVRDRRKNYFFVITG